MFISGGVACLSLAVYSPSVSGQRHHHHHHHHLQQHQQHPLIPSLLKTGQLSAACPLTLPHT
eukprot:1138989-Pelagomonas_calceolata.AAC.3